MSTSVQVISIIFYAGFAISVSIVTMALFGEIGIALAVFLAWQWGRIPAISGRFALEHGVAALRPDVPEDTAKPSGNTSFDAYRETLLQRLEVEQTQFEGFLTRLRDAKDKHEFDAFMDDRAREVQAKA
ncbi:DUF2852 domain-containing protein [Gymnodinialimonas sp. 2305UL16-5]|uniref:DUF2852 domain-containing protein n=1 Tax=Gymnodinialimonas mytili TaxID=3126503 RepID=UPI0030AB3369